MDTSSPDPALVGKVFVKQYYTQMHKDPSQLHRFYLEQSSFVHGGADIGSENPVLGQKSIHDKIESLNLRQVHAKIKQVDSHATLGNGIVVQVTGELSTGGRPMRAFVQTFVLAPESPKKYYVHNDIFRYQDEDLSESETNETPGDVDTSLMDGMEEYPVIPTSITPEVGKGGVVEQDGGMFPSQGSVGMEQNEVHDVGVAPGGWNYEDPPHLRQNGLPEELEPQVIPSDYPIETSSHVTSAAEQGEMAVVTGGERYSPQDMHKDDKSLSWAGMLAKQQQPGSAQNHPLTSTTVSGSQALPQREPPKSRRQDFPRATAAVPASNHIAPTPKESSKKITSASSSSRDAPDTCQIFVGGLPPQVSEDEIRQVFSEYESITEVRVNPKNFAFVVFKGPEPVEKIMSMKEKFCLRGKFLNIEPKRPSSRGGPGGGGYSRGVGNRGFSGVGNKGRGGGTSGKPARR